MVYLSLQALSVLFMRDVAPTLRLTLTSLSSVYTDFMISPTLEVKEMILASGANGFFPVGTWLYHN